MQTSSRLLLKVALLLSSSMTVMAGATIAASLPKINQVFEYYPNADLLSKLVLTVPGLFIAIFSPLAGIFVDRFGRKKLLLSSLVLYGFAGVSGYFLGNLYLILVGRAFLGIAVAGIMTTTNTLIADYFEAEERNQFMGIQGTSIAIGGIIFITLGGFLADISWRIPFLIYLFSFVVIPFGIWVLYEPQLKKIEKGKPKATLPKGSGKWVMMNYITAFLGMVIFYMVPVQIPFLLKQIAQASEFEIGGAISFGMMAGAFISFNYKTVRKYLTFTQIYSAIFFFMALGYLIISFGNSYFVIVLGLIVNGLGFGMMMPNTSLCLMALAPVELRGRIIGGVSAFTFTGQFFSPILVQPLQGITENLSLTFGIVSIIMFVFSVVFLLINKIST